MKTLHILRTQPDETVKKFIEALSDGEEAKQTPLYTDDVDWPQLVEDIFSYDKVISWW